MAYSDIKDPSAHFQALTYTGNGTTTNNVTNTGNSNLQPDLVWIKDRSVARDHVVTDSSRDGEVASGTNLVLTPNTTEAEASSTGFGINYATNGINFDAAWAKVNASGQTYVAWQWKANGGTTASNTDGDLTSTVQFNSTAGFSIVTYTGKDPIEPLQVGHGMGEAPDVIIIKNRSSARLWAVYHKELTSPAANRYLILNVSTYGELANSTLWGNVAPSSTIITTGENAGVNQPNENLVAYCWKERQGFSKFGTYKANANANGPFVYTGFKPAVVINKRTDQGGPWTIFDNGRCPNNVNNAKLSPDTNGAEITTTGDPIDFLSNGYKLRGSGGDCNASGGTYIYMAFAENPFVTSTGIPATAR